MNNLLVRIRKIIKKPYFKYVIITVGFVIWMTFLDTNSFQIHNELNNEIDMLEKKKQALIEETKKEKQPKPGSYKGRLNSAPEIKRTTLNNFKNA